MQLSLIQTPAADTGVERGERFAPVSARNAGLPELRTRRRLVVADTGCPSGQASEVALSNPIRLFRKRGRGRWSSIDRQTLEWLVGDVSYELEVLVNV